VEDHVGRLSKSIRQAGMALALGILAANLGCTREAGKSERLKLAIPSSFQGAHSKVGAFATLKPAHVVINVHSSEAGGGILATADWDGCHDECDPNTMSSPPTFELSVPSGNGRLVQILIAAVDVADPDAGYSWLYDDEVVNLSPGATVDVPLVPALVGGATPSEGRLVGRYLTSATSGPTGPLEIYVKPVATRPGMLLERNYMYNGYFSTFVLDGAGFQFVMPENGGLMPFGSSGFTFSSLSYGPQLAKIQVPDFYRSWDGGVTRRFEKAQTIVFGFFGSSAFTTGKHACIPTSPSSVPNAFAGSTGGTLVNWAISAPSASQMGPLAGGYPSACTGVELEDYFAIDTSMIGPQGFDSVFKTRGAFKIFTDGSYYDAVHYTYSANVLTLDWDFLPGVTTALRPVEKVAVFLNPSGASQIPDGGELKCAQVASMPGFNRVDVPSAVSQLAISNVGSISSYGAVLCPVVEGRLVDKAVKVHLNSGPMGGGKQVKITGSSTITQNVCVPISVELRDSSDNPTTPDGGSASFTLYSGGTSFYSDASCLFNIGSSPVVNFAAADQVKTVYYKYSSPGYRTIDLLPPPTDYQYFNGLSLGVVPSTPGTLDHYVVSAPPGMAQSQCYRIGIAREDSTNYPTTDPSAVTVNLVLDDGSTPTPSDGTFHTDSACLSASVNSMVIAAGSHTGDVFFKPLNPVSGAAFSRRILADSVSPTASTTSPPFVNIGPNVVASYQLMDGPSPVTSINGTCRRVFLEAMNNANAWLKVPAPVAVNLNFSGSATVTFHGPDNTCGTAGTASDTISFPANSSTSNAFYIKVSSGSGIVNLNFADGVVSGSSTSISSSP
jgi:hypothetical protein